MPNQGQKTDNDAATLHFVQDDMSEYIDLYHHDQPERHRFGLAFHSPVDPQPVGSVGAIAFPGISDTPAREDHVHAFVGGGGGGGGLTLADVAYRFVQATASAVWTINHTLGFYPNVTAVDSTHRVVIPEINYLSSTSIQLTFSPATAGEAYLS